jgi:hypothetical protein
MVNECSIFHVKSQENLGSAPYNIVAVVGVWRAAERDEGPRARAGLLRIVTLVGMVRLSVT